MRTHPTSRRRSTAALVVAAVVAATIALAGTAPTPTAADSNEAPDAPGIFRSITAGESDTCVRLGTGQVKCWGDGSWDRTGYADQVPGFLVSRGDEPNEMGADLEPLNLGAGHTATALSAGLRHTCAILDDATVRCWGGNYSGQLGQGISVDSLPPGDGLPAVALGAGRTALHLAAGQRHTCAILDDHTLKCWGNNNRGQLGLGDSAGRGTTSAGMGDNLPAVDLGTGRTAVAVTGGEEHTCALLDNGTVKCWGVNSSGQLGLGDTDNLGDALVEMGDDLPAVDLGTGRTAMALTAGTDHTCAVLDNGTLKCWGVNTSGQLGLGDTANRGDGPDEMGDHLPAVALTGSGISGQVRRTGNIAHAGLVAVLRADDFSMVGSEATSNSMYSLAVPPGDYFVYVIDAVGGYSSGFYGTPTTVTVTGDTTATADPVLSPTRGSISGTATETGSGLPLEGVRVLVLSASTAAIEATTTTDATGHYTVADLAPGDHYVAFVEPSGGHQIRYHPSASSVPDATPVTVTAGGTATADGSLPIQVPAATTATITGKVTPAESNGGGAISGATVIALRASDYSFVRATTTNASGNYTLLVPPDGYKLIFLAGAGRAPEWYDDHPSSDLAGATTVNATAVANVGLTATTGRLRVQISEAGGGTTLGDWLLVLGPSGIERAVTSRVCLNCATTIHGVPVGNYRLLLVDAPRHLVEYYADAPDYAGASVFSVLPASDTSLTAVIGP